MDENLISEQQGDQPQEGVGEKVVSTIYKYEGWKYRIGAVINLVMGVIFLLIGALASLLFKNILPIALFSPIIILTFIGAWYYSRRGKVLVQDGKYSPPWKV